MATNERLLNYNCTNGWQMKKKLNNWFCLQSPITLLVSVVGMFDMRCFSFGDMDIQQDAFVESFDTTEEIILFLISLPSTTDSLLFSSLISSQKLNFPLSASLFIPIEIFPSQILTSPQNTVHRYSSKSNYDLTANLSSSKFFPVKNMTSPQIFQYLKHSMWIFDSAAKSSSPKLV